MMRPPRRASLLVALSLLTSAATASADCAWVMWITARGTTGSSAAPWDSFQSLQECKKVALSDDVRKILTDSKRQDIVLVPVCLPDTVDPRGPKGK